MNARVYFRKDRGMVSNRSAGADTGKVFWTSSEEDVAADSVSVEEISRHICVRNAEIFSMDYEEEGTLLHGKLELEDSSLWQIIAVDSGEKSDE